MELEKGKVALIDYFELLTNSCSFIRNIQLKDQTTTGFPRSLRRLRIVEDALSDPWHDDDDVHRIRINCELWNLILLLVSSQSSASKFF